MDFVFGILMFIVIILILINFTSITLSDTKGGSCNPNSNNSNSIFGNIFSTNQYQNPNLNQYNNPNYYIPSPVQSNAPSALNKKINLNNQTYDYNQHFFI